MTARNRERSAGSVFVRSFLMTSLLLLELGVIAGYILTQTTLIFPIRSEIVGIPASITLGGAKAVDSFAHPSDPGNVDGSLVCDDVDAEDAAIIARSSRLMQQTTNGSRLYKEMTDNGVCVTVRELNFHAGLAHPWHSLFSGWGHSYIEIDAEHLRNSSLDILTTTLVHESTHIDRAIQHADCSYQGECTVLSNGVRLDEEIAAHGAEAQWWIDFYGTSGKPVRSSDDVWENQLASAYLEGSSYFENYIRDLRSDPRESEDR
jgi:hypothetical protein